MRPVDQRLLVRVANRMEDAALAKFKAAKPEDDARRVRDRELGDVRDLKDLARSGDGKALVRSEPNAGDKERLAAIIRAGLDAGRTDTDIATDVWASVLAIGGEA